MLELLLSNLIYIGLAMGLLAVCWLANFVLSLFYNVKLLSEPFDIKRIKSGILKLLSTIIGTGLLVVAITFVPIYLNVVGVEIAEDFTQFFSILTIVAIFTRSIYFYIKQAYETLNGILDFKG